MWKEDVGRKRRVLDHYESSIFLLSSKNFQVQGMGLPALGLALARSGLGEFESCGRLRGLRHGMRGRGVRETDVTIDNENYQRWCEHESLPAL